MFMQTTIEEILEKALVGKTFKVNSIGNVGKIVKVNPFISEDGGLMISLKTEDDKFTRINFDDKFEVE